jgi:hypothetical protein
VLCAACQLHLARVKREFCSGCYKRGVRANLAVGECRFDRPARLVDTGLRIDDDRSMLIFPDGCVQRVPSTLVLECWFENVKGKPNLLRVLRVANGADNASVD